MTTVEPDEAAFEPRIRRRRAPKPTIGRRGLAYATVMFYMFGLPYWIITGTGGETPLQLLLFACYSAAAFDLLLYSGRVTTMAVRNAPLVLLLVFLLVSTMWSVVPSATAQRGSALVLTALFGFWMVDRFSFDWIIRLFARVLTAWVVLAVLMSVFVPGRGRQENAWAGDVGIFYDKNTFGALAAFTVALCVVAAAMSPGRRVFWVIGGVVGTIAVLGSTSTTAFAALIVVLILSVVSRVFEAPRQLFVAVVAVMSVLTVVTVFLAISNIAALTEQAGKDPTLTGRTELWSLGIESALERPLFGHGFQAFWSNLEVFSPVHHINRTIQWEPGQAHNGLIEMALHGGIVAVVLFLWTFFQVLGRSMLHPRVRPGMTGRFSLMVMAFTIPPLISERGIITPNRVIFLVYVIIAGTLAIERGRVVRR